MRYIHNISLTLLAVLALAGCTSDEVERLERTVTMTIPIEVYSSNNEVTSRAASQGDPGNAVVFEQPLYLYVYACVGETDASSKATYELLYKEFVHPSKSGQTVDDYSPYNWTLVDEDTKNERWTKDVDVTFKISTALTGESRVFAIASRDDLSKVLSKTYTNNSSQTGTDLRSNVEAMTLNLSDFTSAQLRDIYSTPLDDTNNGVITSTTNNNNVTTLTCSTVRLYHVAAKVDFTWEVASDKQSTTELASITCTGLPTTCKVFEPTENPTQDGSGNPTNTGTCLVLGTKSSSSTSTTPSPSDPVNEVNAGNKWLGRAYAFMLQPPSTGEINYTVTYSDSANKKATTSSITPDQTTYSKVFTGWYRVVATVE